MDYILIAVIILSASSLLMPLLRLTSNEQNRDPAYILMAAIIAALAFVGLNTLSPQPTTSFTNLLTSDNLGGLFAIVTLSVTLFVTAASLTLQPSTNSAHYYSLLSFAALGMLLLSYSADLLMLFIAWELMSIPTYVLAGFNKRSRESNEASIKYAILGALSSAIILYAISLTYGVTGTTQILPAVKSIASQPFNPIASVAILLFIVGFGFKMSIVPFHMWAPDVYEGAPTPISTLLAAATKNAGFIAAIRVVLAASTLYVITQNPIFTVANIFAVLALITMTLGNVAALTQKSLTRLLAYSSISQAGYMLIGFVIYSYAYGQNNPSYDVQATLGMAGTFFHVINYAIMKGTAFVAVGLVILKLRSGDVQALNGLGKRMPKTAFALAISLLGLAGVPPLSGFWSKLLIFMSVLNSPYAWLAVAGVVNSAVSMGYYGWIIKRMYMDEAEKGESIREPTSMVIIFGVLTSLTVLFGIFPGPLIYFAQSVVPAIAGIQASSNYLNSIMSGIGSLSTNQYALPLMVVVVVLVIAIAIFLSRTNLRQASEEQKTGREQVKEEIKE